MGFWVVHKKRITTATMTKDIVGCSRINIEGKDSVSME